jgi:uncharacterized membrane protein HdeD (DUF308 family)
MPNEEATAATPGSASPPEAERAALRRRIAGLWWIGAARGVLALFLGVSMILASGSPGHVATYLAIYWLSGGILTLRFAWAIRPRKGFRLASFAGWVAVVASCFVLLREALSNTIDPATLVDVFGYTAMAMGALRLIGAFAIEQRTGRRWTLGGLVLGALEVIIGILLVVVDVTSPAVVKTVAGWTLVSGTILLIEAFRVRAAGDP